jgi:hypothetical protein
MSSPPSSSATGPSTRPTPYSSARVLAHPQVRIAWILHAWWVVSSNEHLMVHVAVDEGSRSAAQALLEAVLANDVPLGPESPHVALHVLEPHEADQAAELDGLALDSVRADHAAGRVHERYGSTSAAPARTSIAAPSDQLESHEVVQVPADAIEGDSDSLAPWR